MDDGKGAVLNLAHVVITSAQRGGAHAVGKPTPGLVLLHGRGANEMDLMGVESVLDPRFTVVSPRAPIRFGPGFAWYSMGQVGSPHDETLKSSLAELVAFLRALPDAYNIDPDRLYLMGFSQGAVMSAAVALTEPHLVQGVVMHSGYVPVNSGLALNPDGVRGKPFFLAHGLYDDVIPVVYGRQSHTYLQSAGADITYREYPIGHSISEESLDDFSEWLTRRLDKAEQASS